MDRLQAMAIFVRVAECGSFSRAAEQLHLPRAAVSQWIQRLESHLGARLLQRTTRQVQLTPEGVLYLQRCRDVLAAAEDADAAVGGGQLQLNGNLRIDLPGRMARQLLIPRLGTFLAHYPGLKVELSINDRPVDLVREGIDCVVRVGTLHDSTLVARPLGQLQVVNVASPAYLQRMGIPNTPDDLDHHQAIQYLSASNGKAYDWEWLDGNRIHSRVMGGSVMVNNADAYLACALAGLGLAQVPAYATDELIASGSLVTVLANYPPPPLPVALVYPAHRHLSHRVRVFGDWLAQVFSEASSRTV